jgi:hypothetical protein
MAKRYLFAWGEACAWWFKKVVAGLVLQTIVSSHFQQKGLWNNGLYWQSFFNSSKKSIVLVLQF